MEQPLSAAQLAFLNEKMGRLNESELNIMMLLKAPPSGRRKTRLDQLNAREADLLINGLVRRENMQQDVIDASPTPDLSKME